MEIKKENLFVHIPYRILLNNLEKLVDFGLNVEIYIDGEGLDTYTLREVDLINSFFEKVGLKKIIHGPIYDLNPGSLDARIRKVSQQRIIQTISFCEKLNSNHIVFHHGFNHIYYKNHQEKWLENCLVIWEQIVEYCLKKKINLAIENSLDPEPSIILELIKKINSPNFKACFDIGHFNVFGEKSSLEIFYEYPGEVIDEIHLSDNVGDFDSHLALGKGNIDFERFFKLLKEKNIFPIITIEPHSFAEFQESFDYLSKLNI